MLVNQHFYVCFLKNVGFIALPAFNVDLSGFLDFSGFLGFSGFFNLFSFSDF